MTILLTANTAYLQLHDSPTRCIPLHDILDALESKFPEFSHKLFKIELKTFLTRLILKYLQNSKIGHFSVTNLFYNIDVKRY